MFVLEKIKKMSKDELHVLFANLESTRGLMLWPFSLQKSQDKVPIIDPDNNH